ncbi:ATP-binding protein [Nocardia huaxiensis]|uniref:STAS domain-containing protein n=1 Tax=Nocardia huaxiensis TaxID=2755382 RepID=A0A7D6ZRH7_9NOCA|nr:ATP-binding protein [Nocardia huaxiensis]QLY32005.1 hypothetical protein H0264_06825 [Nocardia huaxiensis]UFS95578.1 STAS domain-containing protein [Nocardia huaxiensis]
MLGGKEVEWRKTERDDCCVLRPQGELNIATYRAFSDDLVKYTVDEPRAVIVVLDDLSIASEPLLTAFSSVWMRVGEWPGVPIMLVSGPADRRVALHASAIQRFVPIFASVDAAILALDDPPARRRTVRDLPPTADSAQRARRFVAEVCRDWNVTEVRADAQLIVTELVENAFLHSRVSTDISVRMEMRANLLTVAVADQDPREAILREPGVDPFRYYGLHVVARLARAWGCNPQWPTGKVVWATLPVGTRRHVLGQREL